MKKPSPYIEIRWEKVDGNNVSPYPQPFDYCDDVKLTFEIISNFKDYFGISYSECSRESEIYRRTIEDLLYESELWKNESIKDMAFSKIYEFNKNGKSGNGSATTPLFPFEIYMMNDGFIMKSFCELTAINPGLSIVCDKIVPDGESYSFTNPKKFHYSRYYEKEDYFICLGFGYGKTNFYFKTSRCWGEYFQVDNDIKNYENAINGKLKIL